MQPVRAMALMLALLPLCLWAQTKSPIKFGTVKVEDLQKTSYSIDSSAAAVVLADIGETRIVGNNKGWFSWEHVHTKRVHILNKSAFDVSTVNVYLYSDGDDEEELTGVKAYTYNLENGKVKETKLDAKRAVFKDKIDKNRVIRKFTLPDVKEGSIIEYQYTIKSDFLFNFQPWDFQGEYPILWSEYSAEIPDFIHYVFLMQGYLQPHIKDRKDGNNQFNISDAGSASATERFNFTSNVATHRWVMKDVPVLKEESFTSSIQNHISKISFQLSEYRQPLSYRNVMGTWQQLAGRMLETEYFAGDIRKNNPWIGDLIDPIVKDGGDQLSMAKKIYQYVQKNFTATSSAGLYMRENIRKVASGKKGNVAEINMLLTAMLRYAGIHADPVILSTKSNGYTYAMYPLISKFNYTISRAVINGKEYFLDPTNTQMGFGILSPECYNGHARIIDASATPLNLVSDSLKEKKLTSVLLVNDEKGNLTGSLSKTAGYFESLLLRKKFREADGFNSYASDVKKAASMEIEIEKLRVDSLDILEMPLKVDYGFTIPAPDEDVLYFSPMMGEGWKENPFKSANRFYPVEMPYTIDQTFLLRMDVPTGYTVDELPKQIRMKLNERNDGFFEYLITESSGVISMRCRLTLSRSYYMPEEYDLLREFFAMVVEKQGEQIVFKKK